ncbi:hypothetical protein GOB36_02165 [Sinorhizobium meliloti]|uniref:hypothetical protein n=1 Tax=Rhizobium meliloti TaxID=382 RepID=UPI000FDA441D|nr:hypothetical protein [Sinorhizobium meliloti]MDW9766434.1 hypothetical protein [Sinorhizobium meliloti]MDW9919359.1 hypothetical protein [Sinorhizobium meliloti]MDW9988872.1 hypothetical protein [Sinorhizobium meliloti]MDX0035701.1 hypothetical protein [Sinorhizobium meliloti]MDX0243383.1 hypothetical protein [Sinorhizobium meliloti]
MFSRLSLAAGAVAGGILVFIGMQTVNALWIIPAAREEGRKLERAELEAATTKAIGELANEADQARVNRRLCIERGRVYLNSSGKCVERPAQPGG